MTPLIVVTVVVILVATPLSVWLSAFFWQLWREEKLLPDGERTERLVMLMAVQQTTRTAAAVILAVPTVLFVAGIPFALSGQFVLVSLDLLLVSGVIVGLYLRWKRR